MTSWGHSNLSLLFHLFLHILPLIGWALGIETDRLALLAFRARITNDPFGAITSWNQSLHFCKWTGVTCDPPYDRVTVLDLSSHKLEGSLSPHLGNLSFLANLNLRNNSFVHTIPHELGRLTRLRSLVLDNNFLSGKIVANLTSCTNLVILSLAFNSLSGKIPTDIDSLTRLQVLYIRQNNLHGAIPPSIGNLSSLSELRIPTNHLTGKLPPTIGLLKNLTWLSVGQNMLHGTIPPSIYNISSMVNFAIYLNHFHDTLPSNLGTDFPNLQFFGIAGNHFFGSIPPSILNISSLRIILANSNSLSGQVPELDSLRGLQWLDIEINNLGNARSGDLAFLCTMVNASNLEALYMSSNNFGGKLPECVGNFSSEKFTNFVLDKNKIVGNIPSTIGSIRSLELLSLSHNKLSGNIPEDIGKLEKLQRLYIDHNNLSQNIPNSLGDLIKLNELDLSGNKLQGNIPTSMKKCKDLLKLSFSDNNLSGHIPVEIFSISSLSILLDLSRNRLSGSIPKEIGNLKSLSELDVSQNMLSGEMSSALGSCASLEQLRMNKNLFRGTIPSSFSLLRGVKVLNLSHNHLSGEVSSFLQNLPLESLDLSFNDFSGMVPSGGVFKNASAISLDGNKMLCASATTTQFHLPICSSSITKRNKYVKILIIIIVIGLVSLVLTSSIFYWLKRRNRRNGLNSSRISSLQLSYQTLYKATNGFSQGNLIGVGSSGFVYKGFLSHDKTIVVKVFNLQQRGAARSFKVECEALKSMRHRNLLKVITVCSSTDFHGNEFKALVYEFMVNGSLNEWLHPEDNLAAATMKLDLLQRLNIAIDVGCALKYLHCEYCQTPVIHCDLKPSNVLLNEELTAYLGDFGLVKFPLDLENAQETSLAGVRGTVGYVAPEYGMGSEVSTHGDMYSYGIILLEMFSGKSPTSDIFGDNVNLHNYVKIALPDKVEDVADPILLIEQRQDQGGGGERDQIIKETLTLIFELGIACSTEMPRERMDISVVVPKLIRLRDNFILLHV